MNLPAHALGKFPWNKPAPYLREILPRIEWMLAPLSDKRQRAYLLSQKTLRPQE